MTGEPNTTPAPQVPSEADRDFAMLRFPEMYDGSAARLVGGESAQMAARSFAREAILTAFRATGCTLDYEDAQKAGRLQATALVAIDVAIEAALAATTKGEK